MPKVTLRAHYDGKQILLDEPFELPVNAPLLITVPEENRQTSDRYATSEPSTFDEDKIEQFRKAVLEFPSLPKREGPPVSVELVSKLLDDLD